MFESYISKKVKHCGVRIVHGGTNVAVISPDPLKYRRSLKKSGVLSCVWELVSGNRSLVNVPVRVKYPSSPYLPDPLCHISFSPPLFLTTLKLIDVLPSPKPPLLSPYFISSVTPNQS